MPSDESEAIAEFISLRGYFPSVLELIMWREARASVALSHDDDGTYSV